MNNKLKYIAGEKERKSTLLPSGYLPFRPRLSMTIKRDRKLKWTGKNWIEMYDLLSSIFARCEIETEPDKTIYLSVHGKTTKMIVGNTLIINEDEVAVI